MLRHKDIVKRQSTSRNLIQRQEVNNGTGSFRVTASPGAYIAEARQWQQHIQARCTVGHLIPVNRAKCYAVVAKRLIAMITLYGPVHHDHVCLMVP